MNVGLMRYVMTFATYSCMAQVEGEMSVFAEAVVNSTVVVCAH